MKINKEQHDVIELLRIHIIQEENATVEQVLDIIETILTTDEI